MLSSLLIKNYALIDQLQINFDRKFSTITGETGAGKSIILGALSLILGQRFDNGLLKDQNKKCVVEGVFRVPDYMQQIFEANDLDYDTDTVIRREITNNGKSRAFVNDTPVNLNLLKEIAENIIDIHSQHHTLKLKDREYQRSIVDSSANLKELLYVYSNLYKVYRKKLNELSELEAQSAEAKRDLDYYQFQFEQLSTVRLNADEFKALEEEFEVLIHAEEIKATLYDVNAVLSDEDSVLQRIKDLGNKIDSIEKYFGEAKIYNERLNSIYIELKDISDEAYNLYEEIDYNPERAAEIELELNTINGLLKKHNVSSVSDLLEIREQYKINIETVESFDQEIEKLKKEIEAHYRDLEKMAQEMHSKRVGALPAIQNTLSNYLNQLGMPNAQLEINIESTEDLGSAGKDIVNILFSSNKDMPPREIAKVASGGELSRFMLAIKAMISKYEKLPTMIFDEIDMGVSGDIADKMGNIMKHIAENNQVIGITHLPQIASKGESHFMVYKANEEQSNVETRIKSLSMDERIYEIAKMLSGDKISEAAVANAKELLGV